MPTLDVQQIPQWGVGANRLRNDCGPASVAMCLAWAGKLDRLTVDQLALETPLRFGDRGLVPIDLVQLAAKHNLATYINAYTTEDDIRREIDAGKPVIVLVAYRFITGRLDQADKVPGQDGHFFVITGYDDTHFVINDPDVWQPYLERGHDMFIPATELHDAMAVYSNQCVFMGETMTLSEQLFAEADRIRAIASLVQQLEQQPAPAPSPVADPLPGSPIEKIVQAGVNVRWDAVVDPGTLLDSIAAGVRIKYQGSLVKNNHTWASVLEVNGTPRTYKVGDKLLYGLIALDAAFPKA